MQYRRLKHQGGCYFFTVNLADRQKTLLTDHIDILRSVMRKVRQTHPFHIDAIVILPDHLHAIWTLPSGDDNYAMRWMLIKSNFSRQLPKSEYINPSRLKKRERGIWQRRYWEHLIRDQRDYAQHVDYIHYNPVKHGYTQIAAEWPYCSIHDWIKCGILDKHWGYDNSVDIDNHFGE